jgi:hypothetical protein
VRRRFGGRGLALAARILSWGPFGPFSFGTVDLKTSHPKDQGSGRESEAFGFLRGDINVLGQGFAFVGMGHYRLSVLVRKGIQVAELVLWMTGNAEKLRGLFRCSSAPRIRRT